MYLKCKHAKTTRALWEHDLQIFTQKYVLIKYQKSTINTRNVTIKTIDVFMSLVHMLTESRAVSSRLQWVNGLFWLWYCVIISSHAYISILNRTVRTSLVGFITLEMLVNIRSGSFINHFVQNSNISSSWRVQILERRISISLIQSRFKMKIEKWHLYKKNKTCWNGINLCKRTTTLSLFHLTFRGFSFFHRGKYAYSCISPTRLEISAGWTCCKIVNLSWRTNMKWIRKN